MLFVSKTFSMKFLYHEAKLASLSYILVLMYIYATLQPTRLLTYLLKRLPCTSSVPFIHGMWQGEYFWSPPKIIGVVFAYTFFYTIEKVVLCRQLTKPKVVSLTRPALLKHFKGTANHAGHIWSQQALVPRISVPSLQDRGWISLRGEWRLSCTPLSEITKLRVELVKYARKKG